MRILTTDNLREMPASKPGGLIRRGAALFVCPLTRFLVAILLCFQCVDVDSATAQSENPTLTREMEILNNGVGNVELDSMTLIEREPFDRLILDEESDNARLDVYPLGDRVIADKTAKTLVFILIDDFDRRKYQVDRKHVVSIVTFPQLVMAEATRLMNTKAKDANEERDNLAQAFLYYDYLMHHPDYRLRPDVREATNVYLYTDAYNLISRKMFEEAVGVLEELYRRDKTYRPGANQLPVDDLLGRTFAKLIDALIDRHDYRLAERYMADVDFRYKNAFKKTTDEKRAKIEQLATVYRDKAKQLADAGKGREAYEALRQMRNIAPKLKSGKEIEEEILNRFPMVAVGVSQRAINPNPKSLDNWASRRVGKLLYRNLVEFAGQGEEGGVYHFPQGRIDRADDWMSFDFVVREKEAKPGLPLVDSFLLARRLMAITDKESPEYVPAWSQLFKSVTAVDPQTVHIKLTQPHVLPEALLQVPLTPMLDPGKLPPPNGFYQPEDMSETESMFVPVVDQSNATTQLPKVLEMFYVDREEMVNDLKRGDIDIVDRVFPSDLRILKAEPDIQVQRYAVPTVHMLIPNLDNEYLANTVFRKAILHAIDRERILQSKILANLDIPGCQVVSGPFPIGIGQDDPIAYGYNHDVQPATGDAYHSAILLLLADDQIRDKRQKDREADAREKEKEIRKKAIEAGEDPDAAVAAAVEAEVAEEAAEKGDEEDQKPDKEPLPPKVLRLAFPDNPMAKEGCIVIQQDLGLVGVTIELKKLPPGVTVPPAEDYDLLYTEITMEEPLIDARALLLDSGLITELTSPVEHALRELDRAGNWSEVRLRLHDLHFQCDSEAMVLPLWQITEHYAHRNNLTGVSKLSGRLRSDKPGVTNFYENVNNWRVVPESAEK